MNLLENLLEILLALAVLLLAVRFFRRCWREACEYDDVAEAIAQAPPEFWARSPRLRRPGSRDAQL